MNNDKILIIEDDMDIQSANRQLLELEGYRVVTAGTMEAGRKTALSEHPDLIILDILLPDGNGLDLCRELRCSSDVRILFLSALNTKRDVIEGLRRGGDDYLAKPYMTEEFLLRVAALLRRNVKPLPPESVLTGQIEWHIASRTAEVKGCDLRLKPKEYSVLRFLCANSGSFTTAEEIYRDVWGKLTNNDVKPVHNHIYCLRSKLKPFGIKIISKRGQGYKIIL